MTDDPLRRLAERGRSLLDEDRTAATADKSSEVSEASNQRQRQLRSSISSFCRWGWWLWGFALGAVLAVIAHSLLPESWISPGDEGDAATFLSMLV